MVLLVIVSLLLFSNFSQNTTSLDTTDSLSQPRPIPTTAKGVNYKGITIPYGFATVEELNKTSYTGTIENVALPEQGGEARITLSAQGEQKTFVINPKTTLVAINDPKNEGTITVDGQLINAIGTIRWSVFSASELESTIKKGVTVSLLFSKKDSGEFLKEEEIEANLTNVQVSILVSIF